MLFHLTRSRTQPLAAQIEAHIRALVLDGSLPPASTLPSSRELARRLGVDRGTVARAFAGLEADGYVALRRGRRTEVRSLPRAEHRPPDAAAQGDTSPALDLRSLSPDRRLLPEAALRRAMRRVFDPAAAGAALDSPADPHGDPGYLAMLVRRLRRHGIEAEASMLVATSGAQQAFDLLLRVLLRPGDAVAVESPGYTSLLTLLRLHGARVVSLPMTPAGMDLDALARLLGTQRVAAVFTMPCFQNPTGISTGLAHRRALLQLCAGHDVPLVEDGFLEDLQYTGRAAPPIKALDTEHRAIYVGTFSKLLWPGLRLGWVVARPELARSLAALRQATEFGGPPAGQRAITLLQDDGTLDRHTRRAHREYRLRMAALVRACRLHLEPAGVRLRVPDGGFVAWIETPLPAEREPELVARLARAGVEVQAGAPCWVDPPERACLRLSIARCDVPAIDEALPRIAGVLQALQQETACS